MSHQFVSKSDVESVCKTLLCLASWFCTEFVKVALYFQLQAKISELNLWYSKLVFAGKTKSTIFKKRDPIKVGFILEVCQPSCKYLFNSIFLYIFYQVFNTYPRIIGISIFQISSEHKMPLVRQAYQSGEIKKINAIINTGCQSLKFKTWKLTNAVNWTVFAILSLLSCMQWYFYL